MSFSFPPGDVLRATAGVENKTISGLASLQSIEAVLCREARGVDEMLPVGDTFRTVHIVRGGQELGTVWELRAGFWKQYVKEDGPGDDF